MVVHDDLRLTCPNNAEWQPAQDVPHLLPGSSWSPMDQCELNEAGTEKYQFYLPQMGGLHYWM